jgi:hypothetical protein
MLSAQRTLTYEHLDMYCGLQYRGYEEQHHAQPNYRPPSYECNPENTHEVLLLRM